MSRVSACGSRGTRAAVRAWSVRGISMVWIPHDTCTHVHVAPVVNAETTQIKGLKGRISLAQSRSRVCGSRVAWGLEGVTFKAVELFTPYAYNS